MSVWHIYPNGTVRTNRNLERMYSHGAWVDAISILKGSTNMHDCIVVIEFADRHYFVSEWASRRVCLDAIQKRIDRDMRWRPVTFYYEQPNGRVVRITPSVVSEWHGIAYAADWK